jgi:hypothetical protein
MKRLRRCRLVLASLASASIMIVAIVIGFALCLPTLRLSSALPEPPVADVNRAISWDSAGGRDEPLSVASVAVPVLPVSSDRLEIIQKAMSLPKGDRIGSFSLSAMLHYLKFYGPAARIKAGSPEQNYRLLDLLLDSRSSKTLLGHSFLERTRWGLRFETKHLGMSASPSEEQHRDQCLAALAELHVPLSSPLRIGSEELALRDVLRDSISNFHLQEYEIEWTALAYALYLPPASSWTNRYGETYSFDDLANEMLQRPLGAASCRGSHLLYALTGIIRVNEIFPIISTLTQSRVHGRLAQAVSLAVRSQQPDGSWPPNWHLGEYDGPRIAGLISDSRLARMVSTGHLAEWMLYLPTDLRPPRGTLKRAAAWLMSAIQTTAGEGNKQLELCPATHAACALRQLTLGSRYRSRDLGQLVGSCSSMSWKRSFR